jgi:hypothetical protein
VAVHADSSALENVGHRTDSSTIRWIVKRAGLPPVLRARRLAEALQSTFVIDSAAANPRIHAHPEALFMQQIVRTVMMAEDGAVHAPQILICDRDRKWSGEAPRQLRHAGIRVVLTPRARPMRTPTRNGLCGR